MTQEIRINHSATINNGNLVLTWPAVALAINQTTAAYVAGTSNCTTSEQVIVDYLDLATVGVLFLKNLDATNSITYGPDNSGLQVFGTLKPGEDARLRLNTTTTMKAKTLAGTAELQYLLLSD